MCTYDEEVTGVTHPLECKCERISPEDLYWARKLALGITEKRNTECRTYEFCIASDMLTDSEETA